MELSALIGSLGVGLLLMAFLLNLLKILKTESSEYAFLNFAGFLDELVVKSSGRRNGSIGIDCGFQPKDVMGSG